jgi:hypothetical protein
MRNRIFSVEHRIVGLDATDGEKSLDGSARETGTPEAVPVSC